MNNSPINIAGYVTPSDWDRHGIIVAVTVITDNFEKYIIADTAKGGELLTLVDERVRVQGAVNDEDLAGNKIIYVSDYEVINNEPKKTQIRTNAQI